MVDAAWDSTRQVPAFGTFWVEQSGGEFLPYPRLPSYLKSVPIYALPEGDTSLMDVALLLLPPHPRMAASTP